MIGYGRRNHVTIEDIIYDRIEGRTHGTIEGIIHVESRIELTIHPTRVRFCHLPLDQ